MSSRRRWPVAPGDDTDACELCGIHRKHAGFTRDSCGEFFLRDGCFVVSDPQATGDVCGMSVDDRKDSPCSGAVIRDDDLRRVKPPVGRIWLNHAERAL